MMSASVCTALLLTALLGTCRGFTYKVTNFTMNNPVAIRRDWSRRPSGLQGSNSQVVKRMSSTSCQDRLYVGWSAHTGWVDCLTPDCNIQYPHCSPDCGLKIETTEAHITEYKIDATSGAVTQISDTALTGFTETGELSAASDCSVIGMLARTPQTASHAGAIDFVTNDKNRGRDLPINQGYGAIHNQYTSWTECQSKCQNLAYNCYKGAKPDGCNNLACSLDVCDNPEGYPFFGRQRDGQCWCGTKYGTHGPAPGCDCTTDATQIADADSNCVYSTENGAFVGCFKDVNPDGGNVYTGNSGTSYSVTDPAASSHAIIDSMYLLEWTQGTRGATASAPSAMVVVSNAVGGADYGDWSLALNRDKTAYAFDLKGTGMDTEGRWHDGATSTVINRGSWTPNDELTAGGCAEGHVLGNRLTYNSALDNWGRYCFTDMCSAQSEEQPHGKPANPTRIPSDGNCYGTWFGSFPSLGDYSSSNCYGAPKWRSQCLEFEVEWLTKGVGAMIWKDNGGPINMLSRGTNGFLAVTSQPEVATQGTKMTIGLAALPGEVGSCFNKTANCGFNWLPSAALRADAGNEYVKPPEDGSRLRPLNFPMIAHFGDGGEEADRYLLGWAAGVDYGKTADYYLQEVDAEGRLYGTAVKLNNDGWGEVDPWSTMANGCVAWPFTWFDQVGEAYSNGWSIENVERLSNVMHITVVCPGTKPRGPCTANCSPTSEAANPTPTVDPAVSPTATPPVTEGGARDHEDDESSDKMGLIFGLVAGCVVAIAAVVGAILLTYMYRTRHVGEVDMEQSPTEEASADPIDLLQIFDQPTSGPQSSNDASDLTEPLSPKSSGKKENSMNKAVEAFKALAQTSSQH